MDIVLLNISIVITGLIIGSFINVLSYRLPKNIPIILSRSFCPKCKENIPLYRNIPIITYVLQKGKCHNCTKSISIQYPLIELLTSLVFYFGFINNSGNEYLLFIWVSSILITIALIDSYTLTIPPQLIIALFIGEILFIYFDFENISYMLFGFLFGLGYLGITFLITTAIYKKETLGYGDLFLVSLIGMWIGPINILICIFLSSVMGIIIWIIKYFQKIDNQKLPFGTYLSINGILLKILNINFILYINNLL